MNMDKVANVFNRTVQKAEEAFKTSEKTPLDARLESLTQDCHTRNKWAQSLLGLLEAVTEPNMTNRVEDKVLQSFDRKKERLTEFEKLGGSMTTIGENMGNSAIGMALKKCGQCENAIGLAERECHQAINSGYGKWLSDFVNNTAKSALAEREKLENLRLDLDRAKTLLKRANNDETRRQKQNQVDDAQRLFNEQSELTKRHLENCIAEFDRSKDQVMGLLNVQREYYEKCLRAIQTASN